MNRNRCFPVVGTNGELVDKRAADLKSEPRSLGWSREWLAVPLSMNHRTRNRSCERGEAKRRPSSQLGATIMWKRFAHQIPRRSSILSVTDISVTEMKHHEQAI